MEDLAEKLSGLLSDEESVRQLTELAQMFMAGDSQPESSEDSGSPPPSGEGAPDMAGMMKLAGLAGALSQAAQKDRNTELLTALRPHLSQDKQKRVDKAIKLLRLMAVWNLAKENGLLQELL